MVTHQCRGLPPLAIRASPMAVRRANLPRRRARRDFFRQRCIHPSNLAIVLRMVASSWVTRNSHKSANFQPKIWGEFVTHGLVWWCMVPPPPPYVDPLTHQHLGTCFCIFRVSVHRHRKCFRPPSPPTRPRWAECSFLHRLGSMGRLDPHNIYIYNWIAWSVLAVARAVLWCVCAP